MENSIGRDIGLIKASRTKWTCCI